MAHRPWPVQGGYFILFFQASGDIDRVRESPGRWFLQPVTQAVPCPFLSHFSESGGLQEKSVLSLVSFDSEGN